MIAARRCWMGVLAKARPERLAECVARLGEEPAIHWLRPPEVGAVMVRGRMGGTGAPFNLGEMTVTRCALRLPDGTVGHGHVQGRDRRHARQAALVDALMQGARAPEVEATVIAPLAEEAAAARRLRAEKAAATKVEFFTMVRGED
ncbi:phosphonate C-P lyase system protein PhnG [Allgaiera indica]|uniref:Alpha-D-ribose 1-methylphosphonate 5-triphosphate synthase subunit PhnG n=2 Tax=Allgaiera indica TaxID=765699 RepID=A0A1H2WP30_9RHOB|nr:phosphonate C-P lyase system protein PhnG [Allgaiera indica]SDW82277.1 alpha-D-ribose 1-methylphosphonate 5-triphosphate synthase subunit PhnG [Allgaiera indica]